MAIYRGGPNGSFSGKVGSIIGSSWRSVDYIKGLSKRNTNRTKRQLLRQRILTEISSLLTPLKEVLAVGFCRERAVGKTFLNIAIGYNIKHAIIIGEDDFEIDYGAITLSKGNLPRTVSFRLESEGNCRYLLGWETDAATALLSDDDELLLVAYFPELPLYLVPGEKCRRQNGSLQIEIPWDLAGRTVHFYAFFASSDNNSSPSQYLGKYTCA